MFGVADREDFLSVGRGVGWECACVFRRYFRVVDVFVRECVAGEFAGELVDKEVHSEGRGGGM